MSLPKRCTVCRRTGHTNRAHSGLSGPEMAALKADGLEFMGRGFRELGVPAPDGDLLDQLRADTEAELLASGAAAASVLAVEAPAHCPECFGDLGAHDNACPLAPPVASSEGRKEEALAARAGCLSLGKCFGCFTVCELAKARYVETETHECEPSPEQVYYCRHCGADLFERPIKDVYLPGDDPGEPAATDDCDCAGDGDWHPYGSGGCFGSPAGLPMLDWEVGEQGPQFVPWRTVLGPAEPIRITRPGVYQLEGHEYHDPAVTGDWLSNSDARQLVLPGCPAQFRYDRDNGVRKTSEAFAVGHAMHARILGKGESIAVRPAEWDSWRTNAARAWRSEQESAGRSVILPEQAEFVEAMAEAVHLKPRAHELLSQPGRPEMCLFWVDPETGVQRRCMVDYLPTVVDEHGVMEPVDLKSADSVAPDESMERKLYDHAWHRQGTTIADGIVALGLAREVEFYFIVQSKTAPHLVTVVMLDADAERIGRIENRQALMVYKRCLETGVWPDYAEAPVTLSVPAWIARQYEEDVR